MTPVKAISWERGITKKQRVPQFKFVPMQWTNIEQKVIEAITEFFPAIARKRIMS